MIISIKPKTIELFPGTISINQIDLNTDSWTKSGAGVGVSFFLQAVEMRDWTEHSTRQVTTVDENGDEVTTTEPFDIVTQRPHIAHSEHRIIFLTEEQWDNWPTGDKASDDLYLRDCVLENTGLELAE